MPNRCVRSCARRFDLNGDHVLDFEELKRMMEILGAPQTHLALKEMIRQVDEDYDGTINFREVGGLRWMVVLHLSSRLPSCAVA
ncbi:hypothetical protein HPB49_004388 [Dermacentor silvarum]|uniref:Uncharacterized protein n=1 Tax=Dermacentor silvarum TaxID=543639 RepID=A0ACB8D2U5_DERSI|nr:hypothetical protein HPB49_004388 [Dermacentor silvarum]